MIEILSQNTNDGNGAGSLLVLIPTEFGDAAMDVPFTEEGVAAVEADQSLSPQTKALIRERIEARDPRWIVLG